MKLEDATNLYIGTTQATSAYIGTTLVWPVSQPTPGPHSYYIDVPTLRTLNGVSPNTAIYVYEDTLNISQRGTLLHIDNGTGTTPQAYTFYTLGDTYALATDAVLTFKNARYTRITFTTMTGSGSRNLSGFICSSGSLTYDSTNDEYVWTGDSTEVTISMNGNALGFYYICFTVSEFIPDVAVDDFMSLNNISNGDHTGETLDIVEDSSLTLYSGISTGALQIYDSSLGGEFEFASDSNNYVLISAPTGNVLQIVMTLAYGNSPSGITSSTGTIAIDTTAGTLTWTGSASDVYLYNTGSSLLRWTSFKINYETT